jgi:hypothetical protein
MEKMKNPIQRPNLFVELKVHMIGPRIINNNERKEPTISDEIPI